MYLTRFACCGAVCCPQGGGQLNTTRLGVLLSRLARDEEAAFTRRAVGAGCGVRHGVPYHGGHRGTGW